MDNPRINPNAPPASDNNATNVYAGVSSLLIFIVSANCNSVAIMSHTV